MTWRSRTRDRSAQDEVRRNYSNRPWGPRGWWHWSYLVDIFLILVLGAATWVTHEKADIFGRVIFPNDPSVRYPHIDTSIPIYAVALMAVLGPIVAAILHQVRRRSLHDLHDIVLASALAGLLSGFFAVCLKAFTGKPRPNWFESQDSDDSRRSYPYEFFVNIHLSAHASVMMAGMVLLALYIAGKTRIFRPGHGRLWKLILVLGPIMAALLVGLTRTRDYHHDFSDVNAGFMLGALSGAVAYFIYFPPLSSRYCRVPNNRKYDRFKEKKRWIENKRNEDTAAAAAAAASPAPVAYPPAPAAAAGSPEPIETA